MRIGRPLDAHEAAEVNAALDEGLSVLQAGGVTARQHLLSLPLSDALAAQAGAWLWASTLEATASNAPIVSTLAAAVVEGASAVAAMVFARAAVSFDAVGGAPTGWTARGSSLRGHLVNATTNTPAHRY